MKYQRRFHAAVITSLCASAAALLSPATARAVDYAFVQTNLISDVPGLARLTDPNLVNPWGISFSATSPFWISNQGTNTSTLYNATTGAIPALVVNVPGGPTGQVFNGGSGFFNNDNFIFSTLSGSIQGWRGALGTNAEILFNGGAGSVYTGLARAVVGGNGYLYAADFGASQIDVFASAGAPALTGNFVDLALPAGYAPFNTHIIGTTLYVTYAQQPPGPGPAVPGAGFGYISAFDLQGNFLTRFASGGALNAPWGIAIAPASFGNFGGDLLVGNFGDGTINVFDSTTGAWLDMLRGLDGQPLINSGLWELAFGNGVTGDTDDLYFTAGIDNEEHGLFGEIEAVAIPEPGTYFAGAALSVGCLAFWMRNRKRTVTQLAA